MPRGFQINGESLVQVKGNVSSAIAALSELGLSDAQIEVNFEFRHKDVQVNAWGGEIPPNVQMMLAAVNIRMSLIHFDPVIVDACLTESLAGGGGLTGTMPRAGTLMAANGTNRFQAGNHFMGVNITSPVEGKPYRFLMCYLTQTPLVMPLGNEKSIAVLNWRCIPYPPAGGDPWQAGAGALNTPLWDNVLDT